MNIEKLIIHLFPIISVEAGNKAQSLNITLSLQGKSELRKWGEYRKWIILLLFYFFHCCSFCAIFERRRISSVYVCIHDLKWGDFFSQGAIDFFLFSFSLHIIPFIDYHFCELFSIYYFFNKSSLSLSLFLSFLLSLTQVVLKIFYAISNSPSPLTAWRPFFNFIVVATAVVYLYTRCRVSKIKAKSRKKAQFLQSCTQ